MVFNAKDDQLAKTKGELERTQTDYRECVVRLQRYSDALTVVSQLEHHQIQLAIQIAREALRG